MQVHDLHFVFDLFFTNRFCTGFLLKFFNRTLEEVLLFYGLKFLLAVRKFYGYDVHSADYCLNFFLDGNGIEDFVVCDERNDLRSDLGLYNGNL